MYPTATGQSFTVQQIVSGTGVFTGTDEYGRGKLTLPNGDANAVVRVSSRVYGISSNALEVFLRDPGVGVVNPATTVLQVGPVIQVYLRRDLGGILATAAEVVAAINTSPIKLPIRATYGGTGAGIVAGNSPVALTGGADPSTDDAVTQYTWTVPTNGHGGLLFFEQEDTIIIRTMAFTFTGVAAPTKLYVDRVPLNSNFEPVVSQVITILDDIDITVALPRYAVTDIREIVQPFQAIRVRCAAQGIAVFDVRKEARFPYL